MTYIARQASCIKRFRIFAGLTTWSTLERGLLFQFGRIIQEYSPSPGQNA
jgi:hypothetical protein